MKKAIVLLLAMVLTFGLALPAAAAPGDPGGTRPSQQGAPVPVLAQEEYVASDGTRVRVALLAPEEQNLTEEETKELETAWEALPDAAEPGMNIKYFFYVRITPVEGVKKDADSKLSVDIIVKIANVAEVVVKQFIDGVWIEREVVDNGNGTFTIKGVTEGPMAILTK